MNRTSGMILALIFATRAGIASAQANGGVDPKSEGRVLTLQEAVRMALANSPDVSVAEAQAARAGEAVRETRGALSFWYWNGHAMEDKQTHAFIFPTRSAAYTKAKEIRSSLPSGFKSLRVLPA